MGLSDNLWVDCIGVPCQMLFSESMIDKIVLQDAYKIWEVRVCCCGIVAAFLAVQMCRLAVPVP